MVVILTSSSEQELLHSVLTYVTIPSKLFSIKYVGKDILRQCTEFDTLTLAH